MYSISFIYGFYLTDEGKKIIDPMWLYIYFRRSEFCREVTLEILEVKDQNSILMI